MDYNYTASSLMEDIYQSKMQAIKSGALREEKPLAPIAKNERPYELPQGWLWVRLGDYAYKVTDYVASGSFAALKENVLITNEPNYAIMVKTADFSNDFTKNLTYTDQHGYEFLSNSNLFGGELILSNIGSIGKVFIVPYLDKPMTLASNTVMVKVTNDELIKYLYYYFLSPLGQRTLKGISSGTSMMKFNKTQLKNTLVPVAPLEEQKHIVALLEKTQAVIEARQQELAKLDELVKARFVEMFGDVKTNSKGLKTAKGLELFKFSSGKFLPEEKRLENGVPVYGGNGIAWYTEKELIDYPTIIIGRVGAQCGNIHLVNEPVWITDNAIFIKEQRTDCFTLEFLSEMMTMMDFSQYADFSGQPKITQKPLENVEYLIPSKEKQSQYSAFCKQLDKSKAAVQQSLDEAQLLFDSLMQQYFG